MKGLRDHLRTHGAVHALWLVAVLLFIIAALILMRPNGNAVGEYIAFATSLASLILALVAIGQSLIANQSFAETIGSLKASAENIDVGARNIVETSTQLVDHSSALVTEVRQVPSALSALSKEVSAAIHQASETKVEEPEAADEFNISYGGALALYILAMAWTKEKAFSVEKMFENHPSRSVWTSLTVGFFFCVRALKPCGVVLDVSGEEERLYSVSSLGSFNPQKLMGSFEEFDDNESERKFVDAYFAESV